MTNCNITCLTLDFLLDFSGLLLNELFMDRNILQTLLSTIYIAAAIVAYLLDFHTILNILAMPWTAFLIIIGGFTSHAFSGIDKYLDIMKLIAVVLNIAAFGALLKKRWS
jgi:hypothetical protein